MSVQLVRVLVNVWRWRRLVKQLAWREFKVRYAGSALGAAWAVLEPVIQFGLYLTVFSVLLGMRLEGRPGVASFGLYLVSGLVPFLALQEVWGRAVELARAQAQLVRHVSVPLEVMLAGTHLAVMARYGIALALVVAYAVVSSPAVVGGVGWLLLGVVTVLLGSFGGALVLMPAGAFLPDLGRVVGLGMMVMLFATPVLYPESVVPGPWASWLFLNPLTGMVDVFRAATMGSSVSPQRLGVFVGVSLAGLLLGAAVFARRAAAVRDLV
ncbi:MAG: ABC transporter permease [Acidobacteriota bacterium]|jgi:lipopolysaccharide transport system permease protein